MLQSNDEIIRVLDEYSRNFAPADLIRSKENSEALLQHTIKQHGVVCISTLIDAEKSLGSQLARTPQPKKLTVEEQATAFRTKELKRINREQLENSESAFFERAKAAETAKNLEKEAKCQADAQEALNSEIMSYECYRGPNARDWSVIEMVVADLKRIAVRVHGKQDFVRTLALVKQVKLELPDRPSRGDVDKIVQRIADQQQKARENPVDKKSLEESSWVNRPR